MSLVLGFPQLSSVPLKNFTVTDPLEMTAVLSSFFVTLGSRTRTKSLGGPEWETGNR